MESGHGIYKHIIDSQVFPYLNQNDNQKYNKNLTGMVKALCVLCFDDEIGQIAENVWPPNSLDKNEMKNISGLGFPETNSLNEGGIQYIFKVRQNSTIPLICTSIADQKFYYCYTLFIQQKNSNYKRGYMQKSILVVSEFYYKKLFLEFLNQFKNVFLNETASIFSVKKLEKLFEIFNKVDLENEVEVEIELLLNEDDNIVKNQKKINNENRNLNKINLDKIQSEIKLMKISNEISIYPQNNNFFEHLTIHYISKIWNLWELVITETPLLVQADTSSMCSEIVFLLSSLTFPLKYCGDTRPYFTIYDKDFIDYREHSQLKDLNSPILGVINPIFLNTFSDWPILHFDDMYFQENNVKNPFKNTKSVTDEVLTLPNYKRKFIMTPNRALIKTFSDYLENTENKCMDRLNIYLRMYLIELNNDFMRTFEEYFFQHEYNQLKHIAVIKPIFSIFEIFNKKKFIKYLDTINNYFNVKYVKNKKKTVELYTMFINTKSFNFYLKNLLTRIKKIDN